MKIYSPELAPGFMQAAPIKTDMPLIMKWPAAGPLPGLDRWQAFRATWWHRSGRRVNIPTICTGYPSIGVHSSVLHQLGPELISQVEALPFSVEGQQWLLLRPRHHLVGIDTATSNALRSPPHSGAVRWYGWLNAIDPQAEKAMIFDTKPGGGMAWVTDAFVRRVKAAGLEGVRFVHSGYLVRDLADAVPDPQPEKRFPWAQPLPPSPPPTTARIEELDRARQAELDAARSLAAQCLPAAASAPAGECIDRLEVWVAHTHGWCSLGRQARAERIAAAAAAFGDLVCRELGWHWATLHLGDGETCLAIANADRTCALRVERFVERQFAAEDRTLKLQFNLLRAGQWPTPPAEAAAVVE